jgi:hypothetical protein
MITSEEAREVYDILLDCLGEEELEKLIVARLSADDYEGYRP